MSLARPRLSTAEGDAKFAVVEAWIYERAGLSRSDASVSEPPKDLGTVVSPIQPG